MQNSGVNDYDSQNKLFMYIYIFFLLDNVSGQTSMKSI